MRRFSGGLPDTLCGTGSTLDATAELREALPALLSSLCVGVLLDAPCGDLYWISHVDLGDIAYIGADNSDEMLTAARHRNKTAVLRKLDIVNDALPPADAMLCRDFHQHLPNAMVDTALANFARSDITWLLATRHAGAPNEDIDVPGSFRPIDISTWLGPPHVEIPDAGRMLSVWRNK
jgi:SAM-dependent methyltransferase